MADKLEPCPRAAADGGEEGKRMPRDCICSACEEAFDEEDMSEDDPFQCNFCNPPIDSDNTCYLCQGTGIGQFGDPDKSYCYVCKGRGFMLLEE